MRAMMVRLLVAIGAIVILADERVYECKEMSLGKNFTQVPHRARFARRQVSILYSGSDVKGKEIGPRKVKALIERKVDGTKLEECYYVSYTVLDTNECTTNKTGWKHKCHSSAECVNTIGSYECSCPVDVRSKFCPSDTTCVPAIGSRPEMWAPSDAFRQDLRGGFECRSDVCAENDCPCNCRCVPHENGYSCEPEKGYVKYIGEEDTMSLTKSPLRLDSGICVSEQPPRMKLRGDHVYKLRQGDDYKEHGALIDDPGIPKSLTRRIKVSYPDGQLGRCVSKIGTFIVNYRLDDWVVDSNVTWDSQNRTVIVSDIDECSYTGTCEQFIPQCVASAECMNEVGSYTCKCRGGYTGDGRKDGQGCQDTQPPVLKCFGAGCVPKVFRAADIRVLASDHYKSDELYYNDSNTSDFTFVKTKIQHIFEQSKLMQKDLFCETTRDGRPCFIAEDIVYHGNGSIESADLTPNITVLSLEVPTRQELEAGAFHVNNSALQFTVIYRVADEANNEAFASREVKVFALTNDVLVQLKSERVGFVMRKVFLFTALAVATIAVAVWIWYFSNNLMVFMQIAPYSVAYLLLPPKTFGSLVDRRQFVAAVDAWLYVSRLGLLTEHERLTRALQEYSDMQNAVY
ncbi:hypothetical protein CTAYLR_005457 [Chrysophaeum taylorii]|uniref:EGF-like domain-containing protein n=1 Tax=Chrysophaeum taylorii TaxID=2483200 RepID=A0AAD7XLI8_9STRA|nr:hypothetical protein CTAYLR_005457 [Chrysophaeum taylorii]